MFLLQLGVGSMPHADMLSGIGVPGSEVACAVPPSATSATSRRPAAVTASKSSIRTRLTRA